MPRKILHLVLLVALALQLGTFACAGRTFAEETTPTPAQGQLQSEQFMFDLGAITNPNIKKSNWIQKGVNYFFERAIAIMAGTAGSIAVLMMSVGGFMMITSAGEEDKYTRGKGYMVRSAIGLVFVLGAYLLVLTIQLLIKGIYG